jgi:hypothetical protein
VAVDVESTTSCRTEASLGELHPITAPKTEIAGNRYRDRLIFVGLIVISLPYLT